MKTPTHFIINLLSAAESRAYTWAEHSIAPAKQSCAMLNWLTENTDLFGLPAQNWMLLLGGGLLLYIGVLAFPRRGRSDTH
jgi:hypothetical protein